MAMSFCMCADSCLLTAAARAALRLAPCPEGSLSVHIFSYIAVSFSLSRSLAPPSLYSSLSVSVSLSFSLVFLDIEGTDIVYKKHIDISVAVATPKGLVVPVVRGCEHRSWADIEKVRRNSDKSRVQKKREREEARERGYCSS